MIGDALLLLAIRPNTKPDEEKLARGVLAGYPIDDIRVVLYDGSYHDVDSSAMAFKLAGAMAFADAAKYAQPVLLEPIMRVEVVTPKDYIDDVMSDLSRRRGQIESQEDCDGMHRITSRVPLAAMFSYATNLRSRTDGRGSFVMRFDCYEPCESGESGPDDDAMVGIPCKPRPTPRDSHIALPEPTDDDAPER